MHLNLVPLVFFSISTSTPNFLSKFLLNFLPFHKLLGFLYTIYFLTIPMTYLPKRVLILFLIGLPDTVKAEVLVDSLGFSEHKWVIC